MTETESRFMGVALIFFITIAAPLVWWLMSWEDFGGMRSLREYEKEMKFRTKLSVDEFFKRFYSGSGVRKEVVDRLLSLTANHWNLDAGLIRPHDDYGRIYDCDTYEWVKRIESAFKMEFPEKDVENLDGSFDTIARYLNDHSTAI